MPYKLALRITELQIYQALNNLSLKIVQLGSRLLQHPAIILGFSLFPVYLRAVWTAVSLQKLASTKLS